VATIAPEQETVVTEPLKHTSEDEAKAYIYFKESTNRLDAVNASSGACGIGQSLPCSKLANDCPSWQTDYACQDNWFTGYMERRYSTWSNAQAFHIENGWW